MEFKVGEIIYSKENPNQEAYKVYKVIQINENPMIRWYEVLQPSSGIISAGGKVGVMEKHWESKRTKRHEILKDLLS
jgi:hypothetical protein